MNNYIKSGQLLDFIAPNGGVTSGSVSRYGNILSVAVSDIPEGELGPFRTGGVIQYEKETSDTFYQGREVWWNDSTKKFTTSPSGGNVLAGVSLEDLPPGSISAKIRLNESFTPRRSRPISKYLGQPTAINLEASDNLDDVIDEIPVGNDTNVTVSLAAGIYEFSKNYFGLNFITFLGNTSIAETRNILSVTATNTTSGLIIVLDGATLADDELYGRRIQINDGPANGRYALVYRNVGNTLYCVLFYASTMPTVTNASTVSLINMNTTIRLVGGQGVIQSSTNLFFSLLNFSGDGAGRVMFANDTDKIEFQNCDITTNRMNAGIGGGLNFRGCNISTTGDSTAGMLTNVRGGSMLLEGCSFNGDKSASAGERRIDCEFGSTLEFQGMNVFRSLEEIRVEGANVGVRTVSGVDNFIRFENASGAASCTTILAGNAIGKAAGGFCRFPKCTGAVSSAIIAKGRFGQKAFFGASTSVATSGTTNAVSADNGSTSGAPVQTHADGTYIAIV